MRGKAAIIIGKDDEMKGYRVYLAKDRVVVVTQHVKYIETLIDIPDSKRSEDLRGIDGQEELQVELDEHPATRRSSGCTRDRHVTRSISKKTDM